MAVFSEIRSNQYFDSIQTLYTTSVLLEIEGVEKAYVSMGTQVGKDVLRDLDMINDEINNASESDLIIAVSTASEEVFRKVWLNRGINKPQKNQAKRDNIPDTYHGCGAEPVRQRVYYFGSG